ncbi:MAG: MaoC/PaaZ C-terminal domain-containing protein [Acidimicrobiia bacterium]|nr:MaoC/PaaZ C-terminal domain-containing protein [Acidimicrobiia bacterium]MDH4363981.1 MaoC/PaaZ C-terminal domain-containing protein [Acidimicrobiia bacterium]MDH5290144.1 MaoC/PaaZ C-terminal domain-containing protein [Acidimicrobiia bacterium]
MTPAEQVGAGQPFIEDVAVGQELPVAVRNASRVQLFLYSAATWNPHRIHYDVDYARFEGHPDVIVHGPLQGAWLSQYVTDWAGPRGRILGLSWQNRASALPELDYEFRGRVTAVDGDVVSLEVWEQTPEGAVLMPGQATVRLPARI